MQVTQSAADECVIATCGEWVLVQTLTKKVLFERRNQEPLFLGKGAVAYDWVTGQIYVVRQQADGYRVRTYAPSSVQGIDSHSDEVFVACADIGSPTAICITSSLAEKRVIAIGTSTGGCILFDEKTGVSSVHEVFEEIALLQIFFVLKHRCFYVHAHCGYAKLTVA